MADKIPDLDDLLKSIRDEEKPKSSSALAIVPKAEKKGTDVVDEDIDPLILRLLGLDNISDIDYDTYKTLLREKMAAGRMLGSQIPTEEIELLTNEFKRVKGKTGRFKVNAQKIKAESFVAKKKQPTTTKSVKALPGVRQEKKVPLIKPSEEKKDEVSESMKILASKISDANNNIKNIVDTEKKKNKVEKRKGEKDRVYADKTRKVIREERAERGRMASGLTNALSTAVAPVKGVLDVIGDFLKRFLIGTAIMELLRFLENPQEYVNGIIRWMNGLVQKIEDGIKDIVKNTILPPINNLIDEFNSKIRDMVNPINQLIDKLPGNIIPKIDLSKMQIGNINPGIVDDVINLPSIPMMGTAQPAQPSGQAASSQPSSQPAAQSTSTSVSGMTKNQKDALNILAKYESAGSGGYNAVNQIGTSDGRGVKGFSGDFRKMEQHKGRALTDLTIGEIKQLQYDNKSMSDSQWISAGKLHAVGRYQFIGNTLPGVAKRAGISDSTKFTPEVQDLLALQLMKERGISPWVGPSDKATQSERAIVESARKDPLPKVNTTTGSSNMSQQAQQIQSTGTYTVAGVTYDVTTGAPIQTKPQKSTATVVTTKPNDPPPPAPGSSGLSALPIPVSMNKQQNQQTTVSNANQKNVPTFSAYDTNNQNTFVIKSLYNIVG